MSEGVPEQTAPARRDRAAVGGAAHCFMMGEFQANLPGELFYTTNHMWASPVAPAMSADPQAAALAQSPAGLWRFGLTAYAVRLLQDVYFLDWLIEAPAAVARRQQLGSIESKKAESDLYSPASGQLVAFNAEALSDPSVINVDIYGDGWLFELAPSDASDLLDIHGYLKHLENAWLVAQRTIKGQV